MIEKVIKKKELDGKKFSFIDFGSESHGRYTFRLWISQNYKIEEEMVKFPVKGDIVKTSKGTLVLKQDENMYVYNVFIQCGYRGDSSFNVITKDVKIFPYNIYSSQLGSLGVSAGALIVVKGDSPLKIKWRRTGRLYRSSPKGISVYYPNGDIKCFENIEDFDELEEMSQI